MKQDRIVRVLEAVYNPTLGADQFVLEFTPELQIPEAFFTKHLEVIPTRNRQKVRFGLLSRAEDETTLFEIRSPRDLSPGWSGAVATTRDPISFQKFLEELGYWIVDPTLKIVPYELGRTLAAVAVGAAVGVAVAAAFRASSR